MTAECFVPTLNGLTFDNITPDADGIIWACQSLTGWFEGAAMRVEQQERADLGTAQTVSRLNDRPMTLTGVARAPRSSDALGFLGYRAIRTVKAFAAPLRLVQGLLVVVEPELTLQSYVKLASSPLIQPQSSGGKLVSVKFQLPIVAPNPRRYADSLTSNAVTITGTGTIATATSTNGGDLATPPVLTIPGPAVNPKLRNTSLTDTPFVEYVGTLGALDTLVIDVAAGTAILNGTTFVTLSGDSRFFQLRPTTNAIEYTRASGASTSSATIAYRDAYS